MNPEAATASQVPGMEVGFPCADDCLSYKSCMGDDTMDAFGPLALYAQRHQTGDPHA